MTRRLDFRLLGPLEVLDGARPLALGGRKQRSLLALLLLHANEVVSIDSLIDGLWGERAPKTAQTALQVHVSQLRKILPPERLETRKPGYRLRVEPDELDLARFERLCAEARAAEPETAAATLKEALSLWYGQPLADFGYDPFAQGEIARLEELRLSAVEQRIEAELELGRHADLIGELETLVEAHPLRERLREQLILALYRSHRQAEALEAYRQARRTFVEELGIEPGPALRELEKAILAQDAALESPARPTLETKEDEPSRPPAREERKRVSVLFAELAGLYARAGSSDPEDVRAAVEPYEARARQEIESFGGTVESFVGETVMAAFGAPLSHEDDAERAVRAALRLTEAFAGEPELAVRAAVATGEAVVSVEEGAGEVIGEVVNAAARLKETARPGEVVVGARTYRVTKDVVDYEELADGWRALAARGPETEQAQARTPFVGRKDELSLLEQTFTRTARECSVQLVSVTGEPGVGKSRLVRELRASLERQHPSFRWLEGRCLPYGEGITFWALGEIVKAHAGILESDDPDRAAAKLATAVEAAMVDSSERNWLLAKLAPLVGASLDEPSAGGERSELFTAWRRFLEALAEEHPLVLVFEDLHWADPALLEFVEHLLDWATESPVLVVCTARPELYDERSEWGGGKRNATAVALAPLSAEETNRLVATLLAELELAPATHERLLESSGGNPLYAEQFARLVQEGGLIEGDDGTEIPVPETIHALIEARLDTLPGERRELLENAAVVGKVFWTGAVAAMNGLDEAVIAKLCQELAHRQLVRRGRVSSVEGEAEYSFWHELVREVAYGRIPRSARADKHVAVAGWIEILAGESVGIDEILGYHLEQAYRYRAEATPDDDETQQLGARAAHVLAGAGRRLFARLDAPRAASLLSRAVSLLPADHPTRPELLPELGSALMRAGDFRHADGVLGEALDAARSSGDKRLELRAMIERAFCRTFTEPEGALELMTSVAEETIPQLEKLGDESGLAKAWWLKSEVDVNLCRWGARSEALERALEYARRAGDVREEMTLVGQLALSLYYGPTPVSEAIRRCESFLAEVGQERSREAGITSALAGLYAMKSDFGEARRLWERSRLIHEELGLSHRLAARMLVPAGIELLAGNPDEAVRVLGWGHDTLEQMGEKGARSTLAAVLAHGLSTLGRFEEAERFTEIAEQIAAKDDLATQILWRSAKAKILAHRGELDAAERLGRKAVDLAERTDDLGLQGDALLDLAEVVGLAGSASDEVPALLARAIEVYERKGNLAAARNAAQLAVAPARAR